jgi:hypothetical protein
MYALFTYTQYGAMDCMAGDKLMAEFLEIPVTRVEVFGRLTTNPRTNEMYRKDYVLKQRRSMVNSWPMVGLDSAPTKTTNVNLR